MNARVEHRGPDASGVFVDGNVGLGHTRLSIIDLSTSANQPMEKEGGILTYNGEIYNYVEIRRELESLGFHFDTNSDTEVLIKAFLAWDLGAFHRLNGMWAFALYLPDQRRVILSRDRFGIKPLVYTKSNDCFLAASESKQLLDYSGFVPRLNVNVARKFLIDGFLNSSQETFLEGVFELRGGHYMDIDLERDSYKIDRWYDLDSFTSQSCSDSYETACQKTLALLESSLKLRHRADVPLGACLSGGLDSSSICALSASLPGNDEFLTITSCYEEQGFDERAYSRVLADSFGLRNQEIYPPIAELFETSKIDEIVYHQDQPLLGGSHFSEYHVFREANRQSIKVMLDGQGADEYFGGYGEFWFAAQRELLRKGRILEFMKGVKERAAGTSRPVGIVLRNFILSIVRPDSAIPRNNRIGPVNAAWTKWDSDESNVPTCVDFNRLSSQELLSTSLPYQLHSEDRNSMRWSVESRLPFLDYRLIEYVLSLPTEFKIRGGVQKRLLRSSVHVLPDAIKERRNKMGFVAPDSAWIMENPLSFRVLLEDAVRELPFLEETILSAFDEMVREKSWYAPEFFRIVTLHRWLKVFSVHY